MDTVISTSKTLIGIWTWNIFSVCFESLKEQICFVIYTKFLPSHLGFFAFKGKISYFWAFLKAVFYPSLFFSLRTVLAEIEFLHPLFITHFACKMVVKAWLGGQGDWESVANLRFLVYI